MRCSYHLVGADFPTSQLKAAKKDGRLSEVLLDRRAKLKRLVDFRILYDDLSFSLACYHSDRFC